MVARSPRYPVLSTILGQLCVDDACSLGTLQPWPALLVGHQVLSSPCLRARCDPHGSSFPRPPRRQLLDVTSSVASDTGFARVGRRRGKPCSLCGDGSRPHSWARRLRSTASPSQPAAVRLRKPQALPLRYPPGLAINAPRCLTSPAHPPPLHPGWQSNRPAPAIPLACRLGELSGGSDTAGLGVVRAHS